MIIKDGNVAIWGTNRVDFDFPTLSTSEWDILKVVKLIRFGRYEKKSRKQMTTGTYRVMHEKTHHMKMYHRDFSCDAFFGCTSLCFTC